MNSWNRFNETNNPPFKKYYSKLNMSNIGKENYIHSQKISGVFKIKDIEDYHDLYVKTDVLLLADAFENFKKMCYNIYELDPLKYACAPNLAFQACLNKTSVNLELLTDMNMLLMFENGIRGGICQAIAPYLKANNKYLKNYDKDIPSSFLKYLDANNLYGWAMCKKLPIGGFKWGNVNDYNESIIKNYNIYGEYCMIFDVDIDYPKEIALLDEELAFLSERRKINCVDKLVTTHEKKKRCIVHLVALKQALKYGLKLKTIYRVIVFKENWVESYTLMYNDYRKKAKNEFEKDFFKLMNNSIFGKAMENIRKHKDIKLVNNIDSLNKYAGEPNMKNIKYFSNNLLDNLT